MAEIIWAIVLTVTAMVGFRLVQLRPRVGWPVFMVNQAQWLAYSISIHSLAVLVPTIAYACIGIWNLFTVYRRRKPTQSKGSVVDLGMLNDAFEEFYKPNIQAQLYGMPVVFDSKIPKGAVFITQDAWYAPADIFDILKGDQS